MSCHRDRWVCGGINGIKSGNGWGSSHQGAHESNAPPWVVLHVRQMELRLLPAAEWSWARTREKAKGRCGGVQQLQSPRCHFVRLTKKSSLWKLKTSFLVIRFPGIQWQNFLASGYKTSWWAKKSWIHHLKQRRSNIQLLRCEDNLRLQKWTKSPGQESEANEEVLKQFSLIWQKNWINPVVKPPWTTLTSLSWFLSSFNGTAHSSCLCHADTCSCFLSTHDL